MTVADAEAIEMVDVRVWSRPGCPRAAGRVDSGPEAGYVHLVLRLPRRSDQDVWVTACPAGDGDDPWARQVRPSMETVDCPVCMAGAAEAVAGVNKTVAELRWAEGTYRDVIEKFLAWAGTELGDEGGAVLAVYGGTRLYPMRPDEREKAIGKWLESTRRYPLD